MIKIRRFENLHILLWLLKDLSWLMLWRELGIFMIFPTLLVAFFITWKMREVREELLHNLAVIFWISANSFWMLCEFFDYEELRIYAAIPFGIGLVLIATSYLKLIKS